MSTITVQGSLADAVRTFRDEREDIGDLTPYLTVAKMTPQGLDVATLAIVIAGHVHFTNTANVIFIGELERGEDARFDLAELRKGIEVTGDGSAIIAACEAAGATDAIARSLAICFIDKHPQLVEVDEPDGVDHDGDDDLDEEDEYELPDRDPSENGGDDDNDRS